jgi:uncharacterized protein YjiS (DUF1127 family)
MLLWGFIVKHFRRWRAYNRTYKELSRLSDRELADININRGEIDFVARRSARGS